MFKGTGIRPAELLIPASSDISKWSVVACDQYTSEPAYWQGVREFVGGAPSTLNLILPEAELVLDKTQPYGISSETLEKTLAIRGAMSACLDGGVFGEPVRGFILTERRFDSSEKPPRIGLVATIDLEEYAYDKDGGSPVRPTEGTVVERLPPRVVVRRRAPLETSHALLLIEDEQKSVI
ncbi:MAG: DUF1015 domain-containing protein, partial [Oscillospiraceae bacterium]|nr:DUF1015 domain-containing protein [Oscillospiraceae bacterium]